MLQNIKYAYFDMDGTLLRSDKTIDPTSIEALNMLKSRGIKIGFITGRPIYMIKDFIDIVKPDLPIVTINGAAINDAKNKQLKFEKIISDDQIELVDYLIKSEIPFLGYSENIMYYHEKEIGSSRYIKYIGKKLDVLENKYHWKYLPFDKSANIAKFLLFRDEINNEKWQGIKKIVKSKKNLLGVFSQKNLYDIINNNDSKGKAIIELEKMGYIKKDETIAFGDALNDITLFETVAYSVALSNAVPEIKKIASHVHDKSNDQRGIFDFIFNKWIK